MDQNQLSSLDPKLREAYEKVMGTPVRSAPPTIQQPQVDPLQQVPLPNVAPAPQPQAAPATSAPLPMTTEMTSAGNTNATGTVAVNSGVTMQGNQAFLADEVAGVKHSLKFIQLMYLAGGLVFLAVYFFFWMRFFNIQMPF